MTASILLFDGVCTLCNAVVDFTLRHERGHELTFAALQSASARTLLDARVGVERSRILRAERSDGTHGDAGTVVLVVGEAVYERSGAALRLAAYLRWPWRAALVGFALPRFARDAAYDFVARHRLAWFGRKDSCRLPTEAERARFLP